MEMYLSNHLNYISMMLNEQQSKNSIGLLINTPAINEKYLEVEIHNIYAREIMNEIREWL